MAIRDWVWSLCLGSWGWAIQVIYIYWWLCNTIMLSNTWTRKEKINNFNTNFVELNKNLLLEKQLHSGLRTSNEHNAPYESFFKRSFSFLFDTALRKVKILTILIKCFTKLNTFQFDNCIFNSTFARFDFKLNSFHIDICLFVHIMSTLLTAVFARVSPTSW